MSTSASWSDAQDVDSLTHMEDILERLVVVLDDELKAVARFDFASMAQLDNDKRALVMQLDEAVAKRGAITRTVPVTTDEEERALRARVSTAAGQVRVKLGANSALMGEAIAAISARLGKGSRVQGYDRRARTVGSVRRPATTSI